MMPSISAASSGDTAPGGPSAVAEFDPLALGGEDDLMIASDGPAAQRGEADRAARAGAGDAVAPAFAMVAQGNIPTTSRRFA